MASFIIALYDKLFFIISIGLLIIVVSAGCDPQHYAFEEATTPTPSYKGINFSDEDGLVLGVTRAAITGVKNPYQGSIADLDGKNFLMTFRHDADRYFTGYRSTKVGLVTLDENFRQVGVTRYIDTGFDTAEDARLLKENDAYWIVFNAARGGTFSKRTMYTAKLNGLENEGSLISTQPTRLDYDSDSHQKNWTPFFSNHLLYLSFSLAPHKVLYFDDPAAPVEFNSDNGVSSPDRLWKYGPIRGGTPAQLWNGEYLAFFHSSFRENGLRWYAMGAYTFEVQPPFRITSISKEPILFRDMYSTFLQPIVDQDLQVIFPMGFAIRDNLIHLSYGENDSQIKILTMDAAKLADTMVKTNISNNQL